MKSQLSRTLGATAPLALGLLLCGQATADEVDFEGEVAGTILSSLTSAGGQGPIAVLGTNPSIAGNAAVVFDSANPTGGDSDLGTPNQDFSGPGVGSGGDLGSPNVNDTALGMILVIDQHLTDSDNNGLVDDPNDNAGGGTVEFDFSALGTITAGDFTYVDIDNSENPGLVELFAPGGALLGSVVLSPIGNNGVATISLGGVTGVARALVTLDGSGAIGGFGFDVDCTASIGDYVWQDLNGDGVQDQNEQGLEGIPLALLDGQGLPVATTATGLDGSYEFAGLCPGAYQVVLDPADIPAGYQPSPCDVGADALDSECSPVPLVLVNGQDEDSVDFGLVPVPHIYCITLPNSTGLPASVDTNSQVSIAANNFVLNFDNLPGGEPGYLFYGTNTMQVPFGGGVRCVGTQLFRYRKVPLIPPVGSIGIPIDFNQPPMNAGPGQIVPGVPFFFQMWFRDPSVAPGYNTTNAVRVIFAP